jgi:hypothetical protein
VEILRERCNVNICHEFLQVHGYKLQHLDLPFPSFSSDLFTKLCPNVWTFKLDIADSKVTVSVVSDLNCRFGCLSLQASANLFSDVQFNDSLEELRICASPHKKEYASRRRVTWFIAYKSTNRRDLRFFENVDFSGFTSLGKVHLESYGWPTEQ